MPGKFVADGRVRCQWVNGGSELYLIYHDEEWGVPVRDDRRHFEFLILEGAQAGLSWSTVLNKRQAYRRAFADFDYEKVARLTSRGVVRLLKDAGIIRNRAKIESAIGNARSFIKIRDEFGSFDRSITTLILLAQRAVHRLHRLFDLGGIRQHGELPSMRTQETKNFGFFGQLSLPYTAPNREVVFRVSLSAR